MFFVSVRRVTAIARSEEEEDPSTLIVDGPNDFSDLSSADLALARDSEVGIFPP